MEAAATIQILSHLGTLSYLNVTLISRISAHPAVLAQYKVHRPWALFREGTEIQDKNANNSEGLKF